MYNIAKIFELLEKHKLEAKKVANEIGISPNNFTEWKKGRMKPSDKMMQKIAEFFKLPLSEFYLYNEIKELTADQQELISLWEQLDHDKQLEFKGELKGYVKAKEENK